MRTIFTLMILCSLWSGASYADFDHTHESFTKLLGRHVVLIENGYDSAVNYRALKADQIKLETYLDSISKIFKEEYKIWSRNKQLAVLINAYNGFTLNLILDNYGKIDSIKDIGGMMSNPWKNKYIPLLGQEISLDNLEHDRIRKRGVFDEPLIHVALVCAAKSCPPLRNEAYTADKLDEQLLDNLNRFLMDNNKNRYDVSGNIVELSPIFKWYKSDFSKGFRGYSSLEQFVEMNMESLLENIEPPMDMIPNGFKIKFLKYDWFLNELK